MRASSSGRSWPITATARSLTEDIVAIDEHAIIRWRYRFGPGLSQSVRGVNVMRVRDGLIIEALGYVKSGDASVATAVRSANAGAHDYHRWIYDSPKPIKRDAAVEAFAAMVERARKYDGCLDLSISADSVDPERINLFELLARPAVLERLAQSRERAESQTTESLRKAVSQRQGREAILTRGAWRLVSCVEGRVACTNGRITRPMPWFDKLTTWTERKAQTSS